MADETIAGTGRDDNIDAIERVWFVVLKDVQHLVLVQVDAPGHRQQLTGAMLGQIVEQPLACLSRMAADIGEVLGGDGNFHG